MQKLNIKKVAGVVVGITSAVTLPFLSIMAFFILLGLFALYVVLINCVGEEIYYRAEYPERNKLRSRGLWLVGHKAIVDWFRR